MVEQVWQQTRHGGFRRTRVVQKLGTPEEVPFKAEGVATPGDRSGRDAGYYLAERAPDKGEVGGSNPSPRTPRGKWAIGWHEALGLPTCPYVIRWRFETPWFSVRLHHWLAPDDDRAKHDHPWNFATFVLRGGYTDASPSGDDHLRAPSFRYRTAAHQHTVFPDPGGAWTIIATGPIVRNWGFWVNGKFRKANKYFLSHGHHPCD